MVSSRVRAAFDIESVLNLALIAVASFYTYKLARLGVHHIIVGGPIPDSIPEIVRTINLTSTPKQVLNWGAGVLSLGMSATLLVSTIEGSWWLFRHVRFNMSQISHPGQGSR